MVFYVEYLYQSVGEHDEEPTQEYVILKLLSHAHARTIEEIRREGIRTYNHEYTIEKFFDDIAKQNIYFELIVADVVYEFARIPDYKIEENSDSKKYIPRLEIA